MTNHPTRQRVFSIQRAAEELSVCDRTVRRLIAAGKINAVQLSTRRKGIPAAEVERIAMHGIAA